MRRRILCSVLLGCSASAQNLSPDLNDILNTIQPQAIRAHLEFLADDALEGRRAGTRGFDLAARYMRAEFAGMGLKSGVNDGTYFQTVNLRQTQVVPEHSSMIIASGGNEKRLIYNLDYVLSGDQNSSQDSISAPVVFAGYGITVPEFGYDDYSDVDARGKIVVFLGGEAPASFPGTVRAHFMSGLIKSRIARDHGAIGIIAISTPEHQKRQPWEGLLKEIKTGGYVHWLDKPDHAFGFVDEIRTRVILNRSGAEALFAGEPQSLGSVYDAAKSGKLHGFALHKTVKVRYAARHTPLNSVNVVGVIPGSDPSASGEFVVFTAHLDHLGIGPPVDGDAIYNGALDNAGGASVMLEIARWFSRLPKAPARSVAFVALTGEEEGLLGSKAFVNRSPLAGTVVANLNVDGGAYTVPLVRSLARFVYI